MSSVQEQSETRAGAPSGAARPRISDSAWTVLALLAIVLLGAGLRLYGISRESAWCDEALTLRHLPAPDMKTFLDRAFTEDPRLPVAPIYYVLEYGWSRLFGASVLALRLLSVAIGLLSIIVFYGVASRLYGTLAGLIAACALAVSLPHIYYSQEVRFYALLCLFALVSMWGLALALWGGRRCGWAIHFIANMLMLWSHAFAPLFFAAQGAFLLFHYRRRFRMFAAWGAAHAALLAVYAGWIRLLAYDFAAHSAAYAGTPPSLRELINVFVVFSGGRFSNENPAPYLPGGISYDYAIVFLAGMLSLFLAWRMYWGRTGQDAASLARDRAAFGLTLAWTVIPMAALFAAAWVWKPCFIYRYVLFSLFGVCLLIGAGVSHLPARWPKLLAAAVLFAFYGHQVFALPRPFRPDYVQAAHTIVAENNPNIAVYGFKTFNAVAARYHFAPENIPVAVCEGYDELCAQVAASTAAGRTVWVIFHHWDRIEDFERDMTNARLMCVSHTFGGMPPLRACRVDRLPPDSQVTIGL